MRCNLAYTSLKTNAKQYWYFDSGCSQHMTREKICLKNVQSCSCHHVTFRDGVEGRVLEGVLLVEGLKTNLTSISQFCDQDLLVRFTMGKCFVRGHSNQWFMERTQTSDNCYLLTPPRICYRTQVNATKLWHRRLWYLTFGAWREVLQSELFVGFYIRNLNLKELMGRVKFPSESRCPTRWSCVEH